MSIGLPASPAFRLEKEIKNVITVIAKTSHYWLDHMPSSQKRAIGDLFAALAAESPLVEPSRSETGTDAEADSLARSALAERIQRDTGLRVSPHRYEGWLGVECPSIGGAVWMMRAARREQRAGAA